MKRTWIQAGVVAAGLTAAGCAPPQGPAAPGTGAGASGTSGAGASGTPGTTASGAPAAGGPLKLAGGPSAAQAGPPGADGEAPGKKQIQPPAPAEPAPAASARLKEVPADLKDLLDKTGNWFKGNVGRQIYVQVDKPLYQPGETVWIKTWDLESRSLKGPAAVNAITYELVSPKGSVVMEKRVPQSKGTATNDFEIPAGVQGGEYIVRARAQDGKVGERKLIVSSYDPPRIQKKLEFVRKAYGAGDEVRATVEVKRTTGEPLPNHPLRAQIMLDGSPLPELAITTNAEGNALVKFTLPAEIDRGDALLTVLVDDGGITESVSKRIPIIVKKVRLSFFPEGGELVEGLPARIYFEAKNPLDKPADLEGEVVDDQNNRVARFASYKNGLGRFEFTPAPGRTYTARVTRPAGVVDGFKLPIAGEKGCTLRHFDDVDGQVPELRVAVRCSEAQTAYVVATVRENLLDAAAVAVPEGEAAVVYLKGADAALNDAMGVARVTVLNAARAPLAERLVFRNRRKGLQVKITPDQPTYVPREQVALTVETTNAQGEPVPAELALSVVDDTVISFADDKKGHLISKALLEGDIADEVEEPKFFFDLEEEKSAVALDLLMGTRGWRRFDWQPVLAPPPIATGMLLGAEGGEADGFAGLGLRGVGKGGGGAAPGGIGIGNIGARGRGGPARAMAARDGAAAQPVLAELAPQPAAAPPPAPPPPPPAAPAEPPADKVMAQRAPMPKPAPPMPAQAARVGLALEVAGDMADDVVAEPEPMPMAEKAPAAGPMAKRKMAADADWERARRMAPAAVAKAKKEVAFAPVRVFPAPTYTGAYDGPRSDFRETIFWAPNVQTGKDGKATVTFHVSDAVTAFRIFAEGAGGAPDGAFSLLGRTEKVIDSKLPFSMAIKVPLTVSAGDTIELPLILSNEQQRDLPLSLSASFGDLLSLDRPVALDDPSLKAGARASLYYPLTVKGTRGESKVSFAANAGGLKDEFTRTVRVEPRGFPQLREAAGNLTADAKLVIDVGDATEGSVVAALKVYPSPVSTLVGGLDGMVREPYGCFEQTSSSNYPNVMVLRYLNAHDGADPALIQRTQQLIDKGYNRLVGFETKDKGYEWFGSSPPHEALTAYGVLEFVDMKAVYGGVDDEMIKRTVTFLKGRRDGKGGYQRDGKALDSFGRAAPEVTDAYITWAVSQAGLGGEFGPEVARQTALAANTSDPYLLALAAKTLLNMPAHAGAADAALARLAALQKPDGTFPGADHSITRSSGQNLLVETTALAVLALIERDLYTAQVRKAVEWLTANRSGHGQWGATQATVLALQAMTEYATRARKSQSSGVVEVLVNGEVAQKLAYEKGRSEPLFFGGLGSHFKKGANTVELRHQGSGELPYSLAVEFVAENPATDADATVGVSTSLARNSLAMGENVRLTAVVENRTDKGQPMTLARIGLPGGLEWQTWQLKELVDKKLIAFYETRPREVILYFRDLAPKARLEIPLDLVATIPGTYTGPASSAYLYYTNDKKFWAPGLVATVTRK